MNKFLNITGREPKWLRYSFAVIICVLACGADLLLDRLTTDRIYPFLPAVAAIIASAAWAGAGPGLVATALMLTWSAFDLSRHGSSPPNTLVRCLLLLAEGVFLSIGSSRMWSSMRRAALSEAWHKQLLETAGEGIWVHNENGVITYANARIGEMLGVPVEHLIGRNTDEFFLPADLSMERVRAANLRNGRKEQFDRRLRRHDGSEMWVLTCCNLIDSETTIRKSQGSLAMMTDITERKRAEYALRRSEERFRNLFEGVLEGVYQSTPDGRILAANPMLLRMLGLANEAEMNDVNIAQDLYVDPHIRQGLLEKLEREGGFQNAEYELRRRDGQIITVLENARLVRDENGAVLYYEGTLTDITPRKRIEEQLRQAQKVEALGRLAGGVARNFNDELTTLAGFAQLALADIPPGHPARASTEKVLQAADRATDLTKQLLSFSRRQSPAEGSLDLNQAIRQSETARQPGLVVSLSRDPAPVYARPRQIEQMILTLLDKVRRDFPSANPVMSTRPANPGEELRWRSAGVQPGPYIVLSIEARSGGAGGKEAVDLSDIPAPMEAGESLAMGLAATHATVAHCGGFIVTAPVRSGKASSFHVFLPNAGAYDEDPGRGADRGGGTILLVGEEPLVRELSRDMLERQGYQVLLASNAGEAEEISRKGRSFDLVVTDTVMPDTSGPDLAGRLRADHPGLKVLFISDYAEDDDVDEFEIGVAGSSFLQKPFSADSLGRKIRQMLRHS